MKKAKLPQSVRQGDGKPGEAEQITAELLQSPDRPTAIFCYNDMTALGALRAAQSLKRQVPRDLSLVGFDDLFVASYTTPPLTTVRQPKQDMGRKAMEILMELLAGGKPHSHIKVQGELIVRASTAAPSP
jgi:DNA-binding LacI/PurR family transcriptional regulator